MKQENKETIYRNFIFNIYIFKNAEMSEREKGLPSRLDVTI